MVAENGAILAEAERFSLDEQLVVSEIDLENLRHDRLVSNTFKEAQAVFPMLETRRVACRLAAVEEEAPLVRPIDPHPFTPAGDALKARCE